MAPTPTAEAQNPAPAAQLSEAIRRQLRAAPAAVASPILGATLPLELKLLGGEPS